MNAAETIVAARMHGVRLTLRGNSIRVRSRARPPEHIRTAVKANKLEIVSLLQNVDHDWTTKDWQAFFDERAGITEFDGGLSRGEAEARAFECCVTEWLNRNRVASSADICAGCGGAEDEVLIPFGTDKSGYSWLHLKCSSDWHANRRTTAVSALAAMEIVASVEPLGGLGRYVK
jgi:hypothetical protein